MSAKERLLLQALTNGMELSWLCACAVFATVGTMGRPFPLVEATVAFVGAYVLTRLSSGRGWRVIWVAAVQAAGLLGASAGILHGLYFPGRPLLQGAWMLDFLGAARSLVDWLLIALILAWGIVFWTDGARLAVRPLAYTAVCARFDLGLAAFVMLFLVKLLVAVNGGQVEDHISPLFLLPFFIASLLAIGTIRLRSDGRKAFLSGYRGLGVFLTFTVGALLIAATLVEPRSARLLERYHVRPEESFAGAEKFAELMAGRNLPADTEKGMASAAADLEKALATMQANEDEPGVVAQRTFTQTRASVIMRGLGASGILAVRDPRE